MPTLLACLATLASVGLRDLRGLRSPWSIAAMLAAPYLWAAPRGTDTEIVPGDAWVMSRRPLRPLDQAPARRTNGGRGRSFMASASRKATDAPLANSASFGLASRIPF